MDDRATPTPIIYPVHTVSIGDRIVYRGSDAARARTEHIKASQSLDTAPVTWRTDKIIINVAAREPNWHDVPAEYPPPKSLSI